MLDGLGRCTKKAQLQAIKSKRLHTLYELNYIFSKGSFTALVIPFLDYCQKSQGNPSIESLYKYVEKSENLLYQARFRALISFNIPCIVKRVGIGLDNQQIARGGSAMFFPVAFCTKMTWYRDFYHYMFLNGKFCNKQEEMIPQKSCFEKFLKTVDPELTENLKTRPKVRQYQAKHPQENVLFGVYKSKYLHLTESKTNCDSHQGGDFLQESVLGKVMPFLRTGKIFTYEQFDSAVRRCQYSRDAMVSGEKSQQVDYPTRRPKYSIEVQATAAQILSKNCNPDSSEGLGDLHPDVLKVSQIGMENYRTFFKKRIQSVSTGSIKLRPAFVTLADGQEYDKLENQTKKVITEQILDMIQKINFENSQEKAFYESRANRVNSKKDALVEMHSELTQMLKLSDQ